jgi:hypothetical protein
VRKEFLEACGGFEDDFCGLYEDQAFLVKAYLNGSIFVSGECWDKYRIHSDSCLSVSTGAGEYQRVRRRFLDWFEGYLKGRGVTDAEIWKAHQKALATQTVPQEVISYGGFLFRAAGDSQAYLSALPGREDGVRISIEKNDTSKRWDIQLNQPCLKLQADTRYRVVFQARADAARAIAFGIAWAQEPWSNLGFYDNIELGPEWRSFDREFTATADASNARIHFDLGDSQIAVEIASVGLRLPDGSPSAGSVQFGTLRRVTPVSRMWGFDRGLPIDRYYIENFLARQSRDIRGCALEIEDNTYTRRFGGNRVTRSDILHVVEGNPLATIVGDLTNAPQIPSNAFDCIVLTQTLQLIYDVRAAIHTLHRILKPGGVVLATFPGITQTNDREWSGEWLWSFTPISGRRLFEEAFLPKNITVDAMGNVLSASAFLYGLAAGELTRVELDFVDRGYEVIITVRAVKEERAS